MNYDKAHKSKQEQEKAENPNDRLRLNTKTASNKYYQYSRRYSKTREIARNTTLFK